MTAAAANSDVYNAEDFRTFGLDQVQDNVPLAYPIQDMGGRLLLAAGAVLTDRVRQLLIARGIRSIVGHRRDPAIKLVMEARGASETPGKPIVGLDVGLQTTATRKLDRVLGPIVAQPIPSLSRSAKNLPKIGTVPYHPALQREVVEAHEQSIDRLRALCQTSRKDIDEIQSESDRTINEYLRLLLEDSDLFACLASMPLPTQYPQRHSLHVTMLSLSMGVRAGLNADQLQTLGLGAMLHDIGMLRVPAKIRSKRKPLEADERAELMRHPIYSVDMLDRFGKLPADVLAICYQAHERAGGQGYPRQQSGNRIHPLAKIVGIADTYVALVTDRPHRPALLPYKAVQTILEKTKEGWFEPADARRLLETTGLYPIGSYVLLKDRRLAKVVRSNGAEFGRPILRVWPSRVKPTDEAGELIDLCGRPDLIVTQALPAPPH